MMDLMKRYRQKSDSINDILPLESGSKIWQPLFESLAESQVEDAAPLQEPLRKARISETKSTKWPSTYFEISEFENPWIVKKSNKRKLIDREIRWAVLDDETGKKCDWKTTNSKRQASTSNMIDHLRKQHSINSPDKPEEPKRAEYSILSFIKKERLTHQQLWRRIFCPG
ncbi:uncharacterized protein V1513DRAFT_454555 [Lipomyces chichibuensis]|uniref:uncharacterized protein n=1 Tax=Lipomyces chichibuensis TaxID=1546026 RepID=UPI003343C3F7